MVISLVCPVKRVGRVFWRCLTSNGLHIYRTPAQLARIAQKACPAPTLY